MLMRFRKIRHTISIDMILSHIYIAIIWIIIYKKNTVLGDGATYYTPYVETCDWDGARNASRVSSKNGLFKDNEVHGGFFTVNKNLSLNLFSVLIKSASNSKNAPLIVWTQGQPGCTSMYAMFGQNGPYHLTENFTLEKKPCAWTDEYNVLYLDNSPFVGYSHAANALDVVGFMRNLGQHLYEALFQFFEIFPELLNNDLYLAGEMYSGKYLLLLGQMIHKRNPLSHAKMRLKGFYIGSAYVDPENQMSYSTLLYNLGLIEYDKMRDMEILEEAIRRGIRSKRYGTSRHQKYTINLILGGLGYKNPMDYTRPNVSYEWHIFRYLTSKAFRNTFGLGNMKFYHPDRPIHIPFEEVSSNITRNNKINLITLQEDYILRSVKYLLPALLEHYKFLFYGGQFDLWVPYVHVATFLRKLSWDGAEEYYNHQKTPRYNWCADEHQLSGYWKTVRNLSEVMVRSSGQMIDASQPAWACSLLKRFIRDEFKENPQTCPVWEEKSPPYDRLGDSLFAD